MKASNDDDVLAEGLVRCTRWFTHNEIWDCGMAYAVGPIFIESYAIRASILAGRLLKLGRACDAAQAFCKRAVSLQGTADPDMYAMGYAYERNAQGVPNCACVADASSTAFAIIETVKAYPQAPDNAKYIESLRRFIETVLSRYTTPQGVTGVGILGHQVNNLPEYWCACALFAPVLIGFAEITGESRYADAAIAPLEWLSKFDYRNTKDGTWRLSSVEVILYAAEGMLYGLNAEIMRERLNRACQPSLQHSTLVGTEQPVGIQAPNRVRAESAHDAFAEKTPETVRGLLIRRWQEFADWLIRNDDSNGRWLYSTTRDYHCYEAGLSWTLDSAIRAVGPDENLEALIRRQLRYMVSPGAKPYFSLYCSTFSTALALLSFATVAERRMKEDRGSLTAALDKAMLQHHDLW